MESDAGPGLPADCARRFRYLRPLAAGGFARVHVAEQLGLSRLVAIKLLELRPDAGNLDVTARFEQEARLTASLSNPHVVRLIDYGSATGVPWIATEFLEGPTLRSRLETRGRFTLARASLVGLHVARALEAAHALGILHRDVKPENVIEAAPDLYKVIDFGIATVTTGASVVTQTGILLGSPAYMAPEVILGGAATTGSDLYALGVTLYELVTGQNPFSASQVAAVLQAHLSLAVPRIETLRPGVSPGLARLVHGLMSRKPGDRPAGAVDVVAHLEALLGNAGAAADGIGTSIDTGQPASSQVATLAVSSSRPGPSTRHRLTTAAARPRPPAPVTGLTATGAWRRAWLSGTWVFALMGVAIATVGLPTPPPIPASPSPPRRVPPPPGWEDRVAALIANCTDLDTSITQVDRYSDKEHPRQKPETWVKAQSLGEDVVKAATLAGTLEIALSLRCSLTLASVRLLDLLVGLGAPPGKLPVVGRLTTWYRGELPSIMVGLRHGAQLPGLEDPANPTSDEQIETLEAVRCNRLAAMEVGSWLRHRKRVLDWTSHLKDWEWNRITGIVTRNMAESIVNLERDLHFQLEGLAASEGSISRMDLAKGASIPGWDRERSQALAGRELLRRSSRLEEFRMRSRELVKMWEEQAAALAEGHWPPRLIGLEREMVIHLGYLAFILDLVHPGLAGDFRRDLHSRLERAPWSVTLRAASISACAPDSSCRQWIALGRSLARDADLLMPASSFETNDNVHVWRWIVTWGLQGALQQVVQLSVFESLSKDLDELSRSEPTKSSDMVSVRAKGWFESGRRMVDRWLDLCAENPQWFCASDDPRGEAPGRKPGSWRPTRPR